MADIIRLLPDSVANQIAAGEVIQRPASVIKELVENAVDAGATDIRIVVKDAGKTLIQVIDNGCGMSETDARMAFERHATSKITNADDLFALHTMGFRGEALPSISAISEVELRTRTKDSSLGTRLLIMGSKVQEQEVCVCEVGSVMSIRKLFYNVPVRRKFLKSDSVELSAIMREFERLALVNNRLHISIDNGSKVIDLRPETFRQRIGNLWKNNIDSHLLPVEVDTSLVKIEGFISRPEYARRRNALQFLIVNGRNMRHPYFHKAILSCFEKLIAPDTQPCYFIKLTVDPDTIDVNIHPTKNDIKFENEQLIWPILVSAVKASLGKFSAVPSIDFTTDALPLHPLRDGDNAERPDLNISPEYNPFTDSAEADSRDFPQFAPDVDNPFGTQSPFTENPFRQADEGFNPRQSGSGGAGFKAGGYGAREKQNITNWDKLYADFMKNTGGGGETVHKPEPEKLPEMEETGKSSSICIQHELKYIITTSREGLLIIDQHRAHVKILYERYLRKAGKSELVAQTLMFPETIHLDNTQQAALKGMKEELSRLGYSLEQENGTDWRIVTAPSLPGNIDSKEVILRLLDSSLEDSHSYGRENVAEIDLKSRISLLMAKSGAIKRGRQLSANEMEHLVGELFSLPDPALTPEGKPVYCILENNRIESLLR